jgi:hypothetical protein
MKIDYFIDNQHILYDEIVYICFLSYKYLFIILLFV